MAKMKTEAIVCNIGTSTTRSGGELNNYPGIKRVNVKPQYTSTSSGWACDVPVGGRPPGEPGLPTGHPSFVMSNSFTNQTLAQLDLWKNKGKYKVGVYRLSKNWTRKWPALHLGKIGVKLTLLTENSRSTWASGDGALQGGALPVLIGRKGSGGRPRAPAAFLF
jgi:adenosylhomocysteinase